MDIAEQPRPDNWRPIGQVAHEILTDARWRSYIDTDRAPERLKDRLFFSTSKAALQREKVHLARVHYGIHRFSFWEDGEWAIVAPISSDHADVHIIDLAAFHPDDDAIRRVFNGKGFAVGLENAMFDARLHPNNRIAMDADVWSWLRGECGGLLPVDWRRTALWLKEWQVGGVIVDNEEQGSRIDQALRGALMPPPLFVRTAA